MDKKYPSILTIHENGRISIDLDVTLANWFAFLRLSRDLNSNQGGWDNVNGRSNWVKATGSIGREIASEWTKNSLADEPSYAPEPRLSKFHLGMRPNFQNNHDRARGELTKMNPEDRFKFRIFNEYCGKDDPQYRMIGYEVPLYKTMESKRRIDLVGLDYENHLHIYELKISTAKGNSNSPLMALVEAIGYGIQFLRCIKNTTCTFEQELRKKSDCVMDKKRIILHIVANVKYWNYWLKKGESQSALVQFNEIVEGINNAVKKAGFTTEFGLKFLEFEDDVGVSLKEMER